MDSASAWLYLSAAALDPFVAAWVSVLDEHQMPFRTEVAPHDWEAAFEDLFNLGFITEDAWSAIDFKRAFRERTPSPADVERALATLATLRTRYQTEETCMRKLDLFDSAEDAALQPADRARSLTTHEPFAPLAPRDRAPTDLFAPAPRPPAELAPIVPTRRAIDEPEARPGLPCHSVGAEPEYPDPRTFVDEFDMRLFCCGQELQIEYEDGTDVSHTFPEKLKNKIQMVEFAWHAVCARCQGEHGHTITRPLPVDYMPR